MRASLAVSPAALTAAAAVQPGYFGRERLVAQFLGQRQIPARLELARERRAHRQEVGGGGDVVDAEDVRARVDPVGERGERARQALARRRVR